MNVVGCEREIFHIRCFVMELQLGGVNSEKYIWYEAEILKKALGIGEENKKIS